jgi:hypothetical protein
MTSSDDKWVKTWAVSKTKPVKASFNGWMVCFLTVNGRFLHDVVIIEVFLHNEWR